MGLQGNKATHDFLSLYAPAAKESSLPQLPGAKPPPTPPAQGFLLRTHDFLQPLERPSQSPPPAPTPPPSHTDSKQQLHTQQALPGGVGTFSISHAPAVPIAAAVKQEPPFALQWGAAAADSRGLVPSFRALFCAFGLLVLTLEVARYINWSEFVSASEVGLFFRDLFGNNRPLPE